MHPDHKFMQDNTKRDKEDQESFDQAARHIHDSQMMSSRCSSSLQQKRFIICYNDSQATSLISQLAGWDGGNTRRFCVQEEACAA